MQLSKISLAGRPVRFPGPAARENDTSTVPLCQETVKKIMEILVSRGVSPPEPRFPKRCAPSRPGLMHLAVAKHQLDLVDLPEVIDQIPAREG
jgi:hypothetical protein